MSNEEKSIFEILTDEEDLLPIILQDENGKDIQFEQIATIPYQDNLYCILHPMGDEYEEDEALVFLWEETEDGEQISVVEDEGLAQLIFEEYYRLCDEE